MNILDYQGAFLRLIDGNSEVEKATMLKEENASQIAQATS